KLADERNVPAYVIFSDVSLREMARSLPTRLGDFARVPGVGEQKLKNFGEAFTAEISDYLKSNEQSTAI
nr:HRDC domain-containing protein [Verrucomicrobiota bacterium]